MPKAQHITSAEIARRRDVADAPDAISAQAFARVARLAAIEDPVQIERCRTLVNDYVRAWRVHQIATKQDHPTRIVAALRRVQKPALNLIAALRSLPVGVRLESDPFRLKRILSS